jgi:O-antigen ligase
MKYAVFLLAALLLVPAVAALTARDERWRTRILAVLVGATAVCGSVSINFASLETYRGPDRGFEVTIVDLLAWGLAGGLLASGDRRIRWLPYNSLWCLGFFAVALASSLGAPRFLLSSFTLFKLARLFVVFWAVANTLRAGASFDAVFRGLAAAGSWVFVTVLYQKYRLHFYRARGPFDHSNTIPLFVNQALPAVLAWGLGDADRSRRAAWIAVVAALGMMFADVATMSRAGMALGGLALLSALFLAMRRARSPVTTATAAVVLVAMLGGGIKAAGSLLDRIRNAPEESAQARNEFNHAAALMAADRPLVGVGLNNFSEVLTNVSKYNEHIEVMSNEEQAGVCHHIYRLTLAETGYLGLGLFLIVIGRFAWAAWRVASRREGLEALVGAGFLMGQVAVHCSGFLEWAFRITPVTTLYAVLSGVAVALADGGTIREDPAEAAAPAPAPARRL